MLKIQITDEGAFKVVENDRGDWSREATEWAPVDIFVGYDSENILTVQMVPMQDKTVSLVVTHASCDNPIRVASSHIRVPDFSGPEVDAVINKELALMLIQVGAQDPLAGD